VGKYDRSASSGNGKRQSQARVILNLNFNKRGLFKRVKYITKNERRHVIAIFGYQNSSDSVLLEPTKLKNFNFLKKSFGMINFESLTFHVVLKKLYSTFLHVLNNVL